MFGDDFFGGGIEDLFNRLAGGQIRSSSGRSRGQNDLLSVSSGHKVKYFVFDLSGKKVKSVEIKDDFETDEYGNELGSKQKILEISLDSGSKLKYALPKDLKKRTLRHTFVNGILEVALEK